MVKASDNDYPSALFTEGTTPASPAASHQRLFVRSSDHALATVNSSGAVTAYQSAAFSGAAVNNSSDQAISTSGEAIVTMNTELFDTDTYHDTSSNTGRFTIPTGKDGYFIYTVT